MFLLSLLGVIVLLAFMASLLVGRSVTALPDLLSLLLESEQGTELLIFQEVRLPRAILGLLIGATLGLSGAAMQGFLRNPLAEPGIIGVSASASFGAVVAFYFGFASLFAFALPLGGMIGAALGVLIVQLLAGRGGSPLSFILAGVAVTSFAAALTSLALNMAENPFAAMEIMFWLMGSLADRSFDHVWISAPFMLAGWAILLTTGRALDALTLGEEAATTLGFNLQSVQTRLIIGTALAVGAATSVAGAIGFIGLVVPHILRRFVGNRPGALLPASALGGAALMLIADVAVRLLSPDRELKLGVLTALVGAPFFLYLILRERKRIS
ncbi:MAG: ABC transporter permease [Sneathiella sp.]|jgi:iron complex transport system permease protein|uniref:FecCD family ABC transporter permease n=1 Tax=Sneathiella sp. TaxID=1964365 RepID=UPI000C37AEAC|nr:iron ABC transporter permease [Sneathiella sp.]MAL79637.1 ABC transporter permease [Sneathiella sp.]